MGKTLCVSKHRFLSSERCLETHDESLSRVAKCILEGDAKHIIVLAGAGISTASGIPDFRTPGSGLYDNLAEYNLPWPEAVFDLEYFYSDPAPFYRLAKELYPSGRYKPNIAHYFIRLLHEKSRLLRVYTQNIDSLERLAGIPEKKLIEAHGTFLKATCTVCLSKAPTEVVKKAIDTSTVPKCKKCGGVIKPDIVFFGENLPARFWKYKIDLLQTDLVLVMGTSLEVYPFASIADDVSKSVPRVLFNRDLVGTFRHRSRPLDIVVLGSVTESIKQLVKFLAWDNELNELLDECGASEPASLNPREDGKNTKYSPRKSTSNANNGSRQFSTVANSGQRNISRLTTRLRHLPMSDQLSASRSRSTDFSAPRSMSTEPTITSHQDKAPIESISVRRFAVRPKTTSAGEQIAPSSVRPVKKSHAKNLKPQPKNALALFRQLLDSPTLSDSDTSNSLSSVLPSPDFERKKHS
ncbi:unnamed protein product [Calicophoron daubneyi]|uniref:Deacetylase sirtuin-type domain-containing protein n=1 Tax=Calicophoron daubneyi TaxID=300641 RepID=A0AAV2TAN2_CALDB